MSDELIDIYNEKNELIGQMMKHEAHRDGAWHRVSHVWIYNSKGEILLQLRAKNKELYPNVWDISAAGHIMSGEDPITGALREMDEEIGLAAKAKDLIFFKIRELKVTLDQIINKEFCYVYLFKYNGDPASFHLRDGEVSRLKFITIDELKMELKNHPSDYAQHGEYWNEIIDKLEDLKSK